MLRFTRVELRVEHHRAVGPPATGRRRAHGAHQAVELQQQPEHRRAARTRQASSTAAGQRDAEGVSQRPPRMGFMATSPACGRFRSPARRARRRGWSGPRSASSAHWPALGTTATEKPSLAASGAPGRAARPHLAGRPTSPKAKNHAATRAPWRAAKPWIASITPGRQPAR